MHSSRTLRGGRDKFHKVSNMSCSGESSQNILNPLAVVVLDINIEFEKKKNKHINPTSLNSENDRELKPESISNTKFILLAIT